MGDNEGPTVVTIPPQPERKYNTCSGCKWYDYHMTKSGRDPIYAKNCRHPTTISDLSKFGDLFRGNLYECKETPDWCPYLTKDGSTGQ